MKEQEIMRDKRVCIESLDMIAAKMKTTRPAMYSLSEAEDLSWEHPERQFVLKRCASSCSTHILIPPFSKCPLSKNIPTRKSLDQGTFTGWFAQDSINKILTVIAPEGIWIAK